MRMKSDLFAILPRKEIFKRLNFECEIHLLSPMILNTTLICDYAKRSPNPKCKRDEKRFVFSEKLKHSPAGDPSRKKTQQLRTESENRVN